MISKQQMGIYASLILIVLILGFSIFYNNSSLTGFAVDGNNNNDNNGNNNNIQKLKISSICSDEPNVLLSWGIRNKNDIALEFNWDIKGVSQNGYGIAAADSYVYLNTITIEGSNKLRVFVNGTEHDTKVSSREQCPPAPVPCLENWSCSNWSECSSGNQTRICIENNACNTTVNLPTILQMCENQIFNETNQTINQTINQTLENQINQTLNQTTNLTEENQNQTEINETSNNTAVIAQTTIETSSANSGGSSSSGGGGGGGGGSGGSNSVSSDVPKMTTGEKTEIVRPVITREDTAVDNNPPVETTSESGSFFGIVGNAIKVPIDRVRGFLEQENFGYKIMLFVLFLFVILFIVFIVRYIKLGQKQLGQ